ncbi:hypothetical protein GKC70_16130 [Pseudomonas sp. REB1044]
MGSKGSGNHAGQAGGEQVTKDLVDTAARIEAANDLTITAGRDIDSVGGVLKAGGDTRLDAGRDLSIGSTVYVLIIFSTAI